MYLFIILVEIVKSTGCLLLFAKHAHYTNRKQTSSNKNASFSEADLRQAATKVKWDLNFWHLRRLVAVCLGLQIAGLENIVVHSD
jgi:hypothetical protein